MKAKKLITMGLALALSIGVVACAKNEPPKEAPPVEKAPVEEAPMLDQAYVDEYAGFYRGYIGSIGKYTIYDTPELTSDYYKTNEYPGNEKYVTDLRAAYTDSKENIQKFVDSLKNDLKTEDTELAKMNENLIAEGEKSIKNIDARLAKLDKLPKDIYNKEQNDFIKAVDEATTLEEGTKSEFRKMLDDMNKRLNIEIDKAEEKN